MTGFLRGLFHSGASCENDQICGGDFHTTRGGGIKLGSDGFDFLKGLAEFPRFIDLPCVLRCQTKACPIGSATDIGTAEGGGRSPSRLNPLGEGKTRGEDFGFKCSNFLFADQLVIDGGNGVLPNQFLLGDFGSEVTDAGPHVAVGQFEPSAGEGVGKEIRICEVVARDLFIRGVHPKR